MSAKYLNAWPFRGSIFKFVLQDAQRGKKRKGALKLVSENSNFVKDLWSEREYRRVDALPNSVLRPGRPNESHYWHTRQQ